MSSFDENKDVIRQISSRYPHKVGFFSDCEGQFDIWSRYLKMSQVLFVDAAADATSSPSGDWTETMQTSQGARPIRLRQNCHFIYGGDVCDRGSGDIRLLKELLFLKEQYPDRVHFLMGNRDVNKLRLPFALHEKALAYPPQAYWVKSSAEEMSAFPLHNRTEKMKWILKSTMGAPFSFECRRQELEALGLACDDEAVTQSYLDLILPGGLLFRYLEVAKMAIVVEDSLYVHGALGEPLGWVPPTVDSTTFAVNSARSNTLTNALQWVVEINSFAQIEIDHFRTHVNSFLNELNGAVSSAEDLKRFCWDIDGGVSGYGHAQPGSRLVQCGMAVLPDGSVNPSVVYNNFLEGGKPLHIGPRVCDWLEAANLSRVLVGHQPVGDAALIVKNKRGNKVFTTISCDSGYSRFTLYRRSDLMRYSDVRHLHQEEEINAEADNEFLSYDAFMKKFHADLYTTASPYSGAAASADTRNPSQVKEINLVFPDLIRLRDNNSSFEPQNGEVFALGTLSQTSSYAFTTESDPYIGKETSSGWFVKARHIYLSEHPGQEHFLLHYSEKFDFKCRIVNLRQLEEELSSPK